MSNKFKPPYLLDEQMYFSDAKTTLLYQIREELKDLNKNIKKLAEKEAAVQDDKEEDVQPPEDTSKLENVEKKSDEKKADKPEKANEK